MAASWRNSPRRPWIAIAITIAMAALGFAYYAAFVRLIERRPVSEFALPQLPRELGIGMLVGAGLYTCCVLVLMVLGVYRIEGLNPISFMIPAIAMSLSSGVFEELVFRGALFSHRRGMARQLDLACHIVIRVRLRASAQSGGHFDRRAVHQRRGRPVARRRLHGDAPAVDEHGVPHVVELHAIGRVLRHRVGRRLRAGLIKPIIQAPDFLTGGSFGLEASLVAFVFCTGAGIVLLIMAVRRGNIMPPSWKRSS